jgi:DNA-binding MarR family transcriptional regulator
MDRATTMGIVNRLEVRGAITRKRGTAMRGNRCWN